METRRAAAKPRAGTGSLKEHRIMDLGGGYWAILNIVGPLLLAAVLLWALLRNRKSRRSDSDTEQATRDLYREEEEKRRTGDDARS
jgi:hypothetical protein